MRKQIVIKEGLNPSLCPGLTVIVSLNESGQINACIDLGEGISVWNIEFLGKIVKEAKKISKKLIKEMEIEKNLRQKFAYYQK